MGARGMAPTSAGTAGEAAVRFRPLPPWKRKRLHCGGETWTGDAA